MSMRSIKLSVWMWIAAVGSSLVGAVGQFAS
jgi:hypothetical protein